MNKMQFTAAIQAAIRYDATRKGFACYPIIGMEDNCEAKDFTAFYAENGISVRGVFVETITPDIVAKVKQMALELQESPDYTEHDLGVVPCITIPRHALNRVKRDSFGEHDPDNIVLLTVEMRRGLPHFIEFYMVNDEAQS